VWVCFKKKQEAGAGEALPPGSLFWRGQGGGEQGIGMRGGMWPGRVEGCGKDPVSRAPVPQAESSVKSRNSGVGSVSSWLQAIRMGNLLSMAGPWTPWERSETRGLVIQTE
jgi:hypothetical protein